MTTSDETASDLGITDEATEEPRCCGVCGIDPTRQVHLLAAHVAHEAEETAPDLGITVEIVEAALIALDAGGAYRVSRGYINERDVCIVLVAAVPLLRKAWEQQLRQQIAGEIEARAAKARAECKDTFCQLAYGLDSAAAVARGDR